VVALFSTTAQVAVAAPPASNPAATSSPTSSAPPDTSPPVRASVPQESRLQAHPKLAGTTLQTIDPVVSNTDPKLKKQKVGGHEPSTAIDPTNPSNIVIAAFSSTDRWDRRHPAPLFVSKDGGSTWSKNYSVPAPRDHLTDDCDGPCDQTIDYSRNGKLFGTFLDADPAGLNVVTGETADPSRADSWRWRRKPAQNTNKAHLNHADQPWLVLGPDPADHSRDAAYVGYDDTKGKKARVASSLGSEPPDFRRDTSPGSLTPSSGTNPGLRLATDPTSGAVYALWQTTKGRARKQPKETTYHLNRSTDGGAHWSLNGSGKGIAVATVPSVQADGDKFGGVNALLGGIDHLAVDPTSGDVYVVYGQDVGEGLWNKLLVKRFTKADDGTLQAHTPVVISDPTLPAALPSIAVTTDHRIGVLYDRYEGLSNKYPKFSVHLAQSTDAGATFDDTVLQQFLSPSKNKKSDPKQRVLGDFQQLKSLGTSFYGTYAGNRLGFFPEGKSVIDPIFFSASAANGSLTTLASFVPHGATGNGRGMAFDGTSLYYTLQGDANIYRTDVTGSSVTAIPIQGGVSAGGPLAWDGSALWTMNYGSNSFVLYRVSASDGSILSSCNIATQNPSDPAVTSNPNIGDNPDGLDWTGSTLWVSSEIVPSPNWAVQVDDHCHILHEFRPSPHNGYGSSGIAFDGRNLWQAYPLSSEIATSDTSGSERATYTVSLLVEDLAYDAETFAPRCAIWGNEAAFGSNHLTAWQIPCSR
jgi:hypothetical protein